MSASSARLAELKVGNSGRKHGSPRHFSAIRVATSLALSEEATG